MASAASLLGARHLWEVVENKSASSLVSLGKALNGTPHLYVEDRWPINLEKGNSQASADFLSKVYSRNHCFDWEIIARSGNRCRIGKQVVARSGNRCLFRTIKNNKIGFRLKCSKTASSNCYYRNPRQKTIKLTKAKKIHLCPLGEI